MSTARSLTLADLALPRAGVRSNALLIVAASLMTALAAQLTVPVPWSPVPVTGQTFAVLLSGAVLGARRGFLAQALYLAEGAVGLPVFAAGGAGIATFAGPTGGYLLAFPIAAGVTGTLAEHGWDRHFFSMVAAMLLGSLVVFALGLTVLAAFLPANQLLVAGLLPFIPGDIIKSGLAALVFPAAWRLAGSRRSASGA